MNWKEWKSVDNDEILVTVDKRDALSGDTFDNVLELVSQFDNALAIINHYDNQGYEVAESNVDYYLFKKVKEIACEPMQSKNGHMEEELLSCPLVDYVRKGIYYFDLYKNLKHCGHPNITICQTYDVGSHPYVILDVGDDCHTILFPKDYGKTWALTREELAS